MSPSMNIPIGTCYLPVASDRRGSALEDRHARQARAGERRQDAVLQECDASMSPSSSSRFKTLFGLKLELELDLNPEMECVSPS
jgi:hypothetical protein